MCELPDIDFSDPSAIPLISGPSAIPRTQSECSNPDTNEICSGFGTCEEMEDDADWCNCDYLDSDGNKVDMNSFNGKITFGDWCQCNQWLCRQNPEDEMECSGRGYCNCDIHDPSTVTTCECDQGFFGAYCELDHEANYTATNAASSTFADYDGDGISDENDSDDDNDEIPDDFEVKYSGPYTGPWKPADDRRATLCPRIKVNLACGKYFIIIRDLWDGRTGGKIFMVKRMRQG